MTKSSPFLQSNRNLFSKDLQIYQNVSTKKCVNHTSYSKCSIDHFLKSEKEPCGWESYLFQYNLNRSNSKNAVTLNCVT